MAAGDEGSSTAFWVGFAAGRVLVLLPSNNSLLARCRALARGQADVMFSHEEVREMLTLVLEQIRYHNSSETPKVDGADDEDMSAECYDEHEGEGPSKAEELTIEARPWSAGEIAEQIQVLSEAAGVDWREELALVVQSLEEAEDEHARQMDEARRHVLRNLVLDERDVTRLALYERQINAEFKSTYSLLERARAYRLGMPVPPPVSVDLTVSRGHDANGV